MAKKFNSDDRISSKELAKHLRKPDGETGKEVGVQMNKGNRHICLNSYGVLTPKEGDNILEIGMGNGFFIKDLFRMVNELRYKGVDFSSTMVKEAIHLNQQYIKEGQVEFYKASIERLPFDDNSFDCITTTNTLYFWPKPNDNIKELLRVLKPHGKLLVAYRSKDILDKIELTQYDFEKYEVMDVEKLFEEGGFCQINTQVIEEPELDFDGKPIAMKGFYTMGLK